MAITATAASQRCQGTKGTWCNSQLSNIGLLVLKLHLNSAVERILAWASCVGFGARGKKGSRAHRVFDHRHLGVCPGASTTQACRTRHAGNPQHVHYSMGSRRA